MTIEEQAQILSEAVAETRAARHHYQGDINEEERRMKTEDEGKSSGVAKAGLTTGIIGTALGALAGGGNGAYDKRWRDKNSGSHQRSGSARPEECWRSGIRHDGKAVLRGGVGL